MSYSQLLKIQKRISALNHALGILEWDNSVKMPPKGAEERGEAIGTIQAMKHEILTSNELGECLGRCAEESLDEWQKANVREFESQRTHAGAVPADLLIALEKAYVASDQAWRVNRAKNDWDNTKDYLGEVFSLIRQKGDCLSEALSLSRFDALMDVWEPGLRQEFIDPIFANLRGILPNMIDDVLSSQPETIGLTGDFSEDAQMELGRFFSARMGFDYQRGRMDTSFHPFSSGTVNDTRMTTRHEEDSFLESAFATFHETGHSLYTQGLPIGHQSDLVGEAVGMMMHESQSLFMEMQLCRSDAFLDYFHAFAVKHFGADASSKAWSRSNFGNVVRKVERSYIRVEADELTYPLHILLRYKLEQEVLDESLKVEELPVAWNEQMQELLGLSTEGNYRNGVMQDTHWFSGIMGYFPSYTMGALTAAQLFQSYVAECGDPEDELREGNFDNVVAWLRKHVHQKGSLKPSMELIQDITGAPLTANAFVSHLEKRYLA